MLFITTKVCENRADSQTCEGWEVLSSWHNDQLLMRQVLNLRPVDQQTLRNPCKSAVRSMLKVHNVASSCRIYIQATPGLQDKVF
jgi:hypothetical protein